MENIIAFLLKNWILTLMFIGGLVLTLGALLEWQWIMDVSHYKEKSITKGIYNQFGPKGYRRLLLACGIFVLVCISWFLYLAYLQFVQ